MATRRSKNVTLDQATLSVRAKAALAREGLHLPDKPDGGRTALPSDLTSLDDSGLMSLFSLTRAWSDYLAGQLSLAEIDEHEAEGILEHTKAVVMLRGVNADKDTRITVERLQRTVDEEVVAAKEAFDIAYAKRKLLTSMYNSADQASFVVSRELSRRIGAEPRRRREEKWNA